VQGDGLVTEDVFAWCDARRDCDDPGVVVGDHLVRCPGARWAAAVNETGFVNLVELELGLVDGSAVVAAGGKVVQHRAMMGLGPDSPLELNSVSSSNGHVGAARGRSLVADDVGRGVVADEAVVNVFRGRPASNDWRWVLVLEAGAIA